MNAIDIHNSIGFEATNNNNTNYDQTQMPLYESTVRILWAAKFHHHHVIIIITDFIQIRVCVCVGLCVPVVH